MNEAAIIKTYTNMIENFKTGTYHGFLPVRVLEHNVIKWFEQIHPSFLDECRKVISEKNLEPGIGYEINEQAIYYDIFNQYTRQISNGAQTPYVTITQAGRRKISLHETFLAYLWSMSYSLWTIFEQGIHIPLNQKRFNGQIDPNNETVKKSFQVFQYGLGLITEYSEWDYSIPNPEKYSELDEELITKNNRIYLGATNFILAHEFSHVKLGHLDKLEQARKGIITLTDADILKMEYEADAEAYRLVSKSMVDDRTKINIGVGLVVGTCSLLYLSSRLESDDHPDTDERVKTILENLNFHEEHPIWGIACLAFQLFAQVNRFDYKFPIQDNPKTLFYEYIKKFTIFKRT